MNCVLIKMGGNGIRFGADCPKQFYIIDGEPLFLYVLRKYAQISAIDKYILVTNPDYMEFTIDNALPLLGNKLLGVVPGGETNIASSKQGVEFAAQHLDNNDILLIHDITDPVIIPSSILKSIDVAKSHGCSTVITEQVHTLYVKDENNHIIGTIPKTTVGSGYSPEAFQFGIISNCFKSSTSNDMCSFTSVMALVQSKGIDPMAVISHQLDLKITYREDLHILRMLLESSNNLYIN